MKEPEFWVSDRKLAEIELERRVKAFDRLVDYALDGYCTVPEAIKVYKEQELDDVQA